MDVPGLSLFQGAESLQLNTSTQQRIEEQDAFEDQQRRNEEVTSELYMYISFRLRSILDFFSRLRISILNFS